MTSKQAFLNASTIFVLVVNWRAGLRTYVRTCSRACICAVYLFGGRGAYNRGKHTCARTWRSKRGGGLFSEGYDTCTCICSPGLLKCCLGGFLVTPLSIYALSSSALRGRGTSLSHTHHLGQPRCPTSLAFPPPPNVWPMEAAVYYNNIMTYLLPHVITCKSIVLVSISVENLQSHSLILYEYIVDLVKV